MNLDLRTGEGILGLLKELQQDLGATTICATRDHRMLVTSDCVVWICDGCNDRIAEHGELDIEINSLDGPTV